jgi:hypothetical protein
LDRLLDLTHLFALVSWFCVFCHTSVCLKYSGGFHVDCQMRERSDLDWMGLPRRPQKILRFSERRSLSKSFLISVLILVGVGINERPLFSSSAWPVPIFISASLRTNSLMSTDLLRCFVLRWCRRFFLSLGGIGFCGICRTEVRRGPRHRPDFRNECGSVVRAVPGSSGSLVWFHCMVPVPSVGIVVVLVGWVVECFYCLVVGILRWMLVPKTA